MWNVWGGFIETALILAIGWWAYTNVPQVRESIMALPELAQRFAEYLKTL
jgi:hypothetical protein